MPCSKITIVETTYHIKIQHPQLQNNYKQLHRRCAISSKKNMVIPRKLKVAFFKPASLAGHQTLESYLEATYDPSYRFLRMISQAMNFSYELATYTTGGQLLANGSWTGALGMINRSEVDMSANLLFETEERTEAVHFTYPFRLYSTTFVVKKPGYTPDIFGLFEAFSWSIWLALILSMLVMVAVNFKLTKHALKDVVFHVLSIFLRQPAILKPRASVQYVLVFNCMAGAMFLGFCYTSVLLSYLTIPSTVKIRDTRDLALAIRKDGYKCMFDATLTVLPSLFSSSTLTQLVTIGRSMYVNPDREGEFEDFYRLGKEQKVAFFVNIEKVPTMPDSCFLSDDYVNECLGAMVVPRDFCCKRQLDSTVHRIVASGLYAKVTRDKSVLSGLKLHSEPDEAAGHRKLTLTEFSLAFAILIAGHAGSVFVLTVEMVLASKRKTKRRRR